MKQYVFVTGHGLVRFRPLKLSQVELDCTVHPAQYKGKIKLPKGIRTGGGKKWQKLNYWFTNNQIFQSREDAITSLSSPLPEWMVTSMMDNYVKLASTKIPEGGITEALRRKCREELYGKHRI